MADECCFANSAPCAGPLAVWHKLTARPGIENRLCIPRPRAVSVRAAETCADKSAGFAGISGAHWTGRADGQAKPFPHLRAHERIRNGGKQNRINQKPSELVIMIFPDGDFVSRETIAISFCFS